MSTNKKSQKNSFKTLIIGNDEEQKAIGLNRITFFKDGLLLFIFGGIFLFFGIVGLLVTFSDGKLDRIPTILFLFFLGSPAYYGLKLMRNKKRTDGGLFPPIFLLIFGCILVIFSGVILFETGNKVLFDVSFSFFFGVACISLAIKRW